MLKLKNIDSSPPASSRQSELSRPDIDESSPPFKIMTLNLRYGNAEDGPNSWNEDRGTGNRKGIVGDLLQKYQPDIFCTQEALYYQILDLENILTGYEWTGTGREGGREDEHSAVFFDKSRLSLRDSNTFWLSKDPEVVGSTSWGAKLPRIVTWAQFHGEDLSAPFYVFNTHFSNESKQARNQSAKLLKRSVQNIAGKEATIFITGDFNSGPESKAWKILTRGQFQDTWLTAKRKSGPDFTFHGFNGLDADESVQKRIDWIIYRLSNQQKPEMVKIIPYSTEKRYPSDHFPVLCILKTL